jgi:nicotinamide mononucleotide transporter
VIGAFIISLWSSLVEGIVQTSLLEWIAVLTGLGSVWYSVKENIWVYPIGMISVAIYMHLAFTYQLYADMGVNGYYFLMSIYGWYQWLQPEEKKPFKPITKNDGVYWIRSLLFFGISWITLYTILVNFTDSDVPFWDSLTTSFAIVGMWLMAEKKLEHWLFWIATDLVSIPLYFYKGLVLTSGQFLIFTLLAWSGWIRWNREWTKLQQEGTPSRVPAK